MRQRLFSILLLLAATGCYYDNEEELYNCVVNASNTKYSTAINNIIISYGCAGCHTQSAAPGGVVLSNYNGVKAAAESGRLYGAISHAAGYVPMPQGGGKMNACDLKKVKAWIDAGAQNN